MNFKSIKQAILVIEQEYYKHVDELECKDKLMDVEIGIEKIKDWVLEEISVNNNEKH